MPSEHDPSKHHHSGVEIIIGRRPTDPEGVAEDLRFMLLPLVREEAVAVALRDLAICVCTNTSQGLRTSEELEQLKDKLAETGIKRPVVNFLELVAWNLARDMRGFWIDGSIETTTKVQSFWTEVFEKLPQNDNA